MTVLDWLNLDSAGARVAGHLLWWMKLASEDTEFRNRLTKAFVGSHRDFTCCDDANDYLDFVMEDVKKYHDAVGGMWEKLHNARANIQ